MIFELKSLRLLVKDDSLTIIRANSFRFWQWASFIIQTVVIVGVSSIVCIMNIEKFKLIVRDQEFSQLLVLLSIFIAGALLIGFFYRNARKSTLDYEITIKDFQIFINTKRISSKESIENIVAIKNTGWRGLGLTYTIALTTHTKRFPLVYYLDENEAKEVITILKNFIADLTNQ